MPQITFIVLVLFFTAGSVYSMGLSESEILGDVKRDALLKDWIKTVDEMQKLEEAVKEIEKKEKTQESVLVEPTAPAKPAAPDEPPAEEPLQESPQVQVQDEPDNTAEISGTQQESTTDTDSPQAVDPVEAGSVSEPVVNEREVFARLDANIDISLQEKGWIFTGESRGREGITFENRVIRENSTLFVFRVVDLGDYTLQFQRQNLSQGIVYIEKIHVKVLPDEEFFKAVSGGEVVIEGRGEGDYRAAGRMLKSGRNDEALEEYLRQYVEGDPEIDNTIADLSFSLGKNDLAEKFWEKNISPDSPYRDLALYGKFRVGVATKNQRTYDLLLEEIMELDLPEKESALVEAALFQEEAGNYNEVIYLLEFVLDAYSVDIKADFACFKLATLYETVSEVKNIQKAYDYYERILLDYPTSIYWEPAVERMEYLERHFLHIR